MVIRGGANLVRHPPAFSNDGKRLLVCTGASVTVFSVATALPVSQLNGHTHAITSVLVVPDSWRGASAVNHAWTASLDGTIRLWDFELGILIRTVTVGVPIESMVIPGLLKASAKSAAEERDSIAFLSVQWSENSHQRKGRAEWPGRVIIFNLSSGKPLRGFLAKTLHPCRLVVSPVGSFVGMPDTRKIWIWSVPVENFEQVQKVKSCVLHHTKGCSVMAFDPSETVLAGGDETGRILCWYNFGKRIFSMNSSKTPPFSEDDQKGGVRGDDDAEACTTSHWHASEVKSLLFSFDGTYLFSGGFEGALVIWQLETGKRQYLPRLGGRLTFITPSTDPSLFAVTCSDNTIRFVNIGTMKVEKSCQGIKPAVPFPKTLTSSINSAVAFDPRKGQLVLPTDNVALQFYDPVRDQALFEVRVSPRTQVSTFNKEKSNWSGPSTFVTHVAFSQDASVMATIDVRLPEERVGGSGSCLKFWDYRPAKQQYLVNTLVNEPHSAEVTALVYHPWEHMVVSGSLDASFKIWDTTKQVGIRGNTRKVRAWRCRSVGSYRQKKVSSAAFSSDGSLLAASAEEMVTLWNPHSNGLVGNLACDPSLQKVKLLAFVHNYLVAASSGARPRLVVWDLGNRSMLWSCDAHVQALSVNPMGSHFGVIATTLATKRHLFKERESSRKAMAALFDPEDPNPVATWTIQEGAGGAVFFGSPNLLPAPVTQAENGKEEMDRPQSCMVVLTGTHEYVVLNPYRQEDETESGHPSMADLPDGAPSAYRAIYGNVSKKLTKNSGLDAVGIRARRPWGDLLNASSHVLPPLNRIGLTFMESFLEKQAKAKKLSWSAEVANHVL